MSEHGNKRAIRGRLLWFDDDPTTAGEDAATRYIEDGCLIVEDGIVGAVGEAADILKTIAEDTPVDDWRPFLIMPGFIDPHLHFPQTQVIGSFAGELLEWLHTYTFVEEQKYADPAVAEAAVRFFLDELLRNGTTTAGVYCSVHPQSVEAFFAESERRNMLMAAGKVMMDRDAPAALLDTPETGYRDSKALLEKWHGRGRQHYAITPRFAVTSSEAQLEAAGALAAEYPDCHIQTHLSESHREIATVAERFAWSKDYTQVYERYGLVRRKALFGHCIHLSESERSRLGAAGATAVLCPTSNLFLGSGLFDLAALRATVPAPQIAIATDIGGGTSYSMLMTGSEAYKVAALRGQPLPALAAFYMMTLGNARAMGLDDRIGSLAAGREADLVVLDMGATAAMRQRMAQVQSLTEELFVLMMMGDDRAVAATYVMGEQAYKKAG
ncbi:MAG: guanine deaminase [Hyphomicrobiales bacterium]|nr:guanine deaminase [Hyphomicrobiales bacterium]